MVLHQKQIATLPGITFTNFFFKAIDILDGLIPNRDEHGILPSSYLNKLIVFSLMWSTGALLELDDRAKMELHMRNTNSLDLPRIPDGSQETIFEYVVDDNGNILLHFSGVLATTSQIEFIELLPLFYMGRP